MRSCRPAERCASRWPWRRRAPARDRNDVEINDPGRRRSALGPALRGAPRPDRRGSPSHLVHFIEEETGFFVPARFMCWMIWRAWRRCRCGDGANLGLVAHAAEREAHELAARGLGDGHAQRGFAHAWRTGEAEDGALGFLTRRRTARNSRMRSLIFSRP